jgi:tRNA threonylcarbamoyladenosine biosynthesis protein TsaE
MKTKKILFGHADIDEIVQELVALMPTHQIFTFTGPLGAGKTTLIRAMLKKCDVVENVTSPTFTYLNVYENEHGELFYHFDLYRMATFNDFRAAGFDEYLYAPNSWTFIEWPAVIMPLLKEKVCVVELDYAGNQRQLVIK